MSKKKIWAIAIVALLVVLGGAILLVGRDEDKVSKKDPAKEGKETTEQNIEEEDVEQETEDLQQESFGGLDFTVDPSNRDKEAKEEKAKKFVGNIKNSGIVAHGILPFEGVFIEKMEDIECSNVPTILLENTTDKMISYMLLTLDAEGAIWTFEASAIPAGSYIMVQEKNASSYAKVNVSCKDLQLAQEENEGKLEDEIQVEIGEQGGLTISNISSEDIPVVRLFYKLKLEGTNVYVGGITYTVKLDDLKAGSSQTVYPSHFVEKYAEILMIRKYDE